MKHINLEQFAGGKLSVQLNKTLEKITENVQDPNTDAQKVRKINVSISFRPNDERNFVATTVETKLSLAPELGATTALSMGRDLRTGEVEAVEIFNQIPGQMNVDDVIDQEEDETPKAFDPDTGEIYEPSNKVIDLREAIEKIEELTDSAREPHVVEIAGKTYCDKSMSRYDREEFAEPLTATSLNSLIDYISGKSEELRESMIIHVESPTRVRLLSGLTQERNREELFRVGTNPNGFDFDHYYDQEAFVINMQTAFKQSDETELILSVAGNVENKTVANYGDDGVSQKATITKGIAGKEDVIVPNPVTLRPYRTFLEVEQPESKFIFRISEGSNGEPLFKLVEADGGLWKYESVDAIKKYLTENLPEELLKVITIIG